MISVILYEYSTLVDKYMTNAPYRVSRTRSATLLVAAFLTDEKDVLR
jgi:hypothetical protein